MFREFISELKNVVEELALSIRIFAKGLLTVEGAALACLVLAILITGGFWFYFGMGVESNSAARHAGWIVPYCRPIGQTGYFWLIMTTFVSGISSAFLIAEAVILVKKRNDYKRLGKKLPKAAFATAFTLLFIFLMTNLAYLIFSC